MARWFNEKGEDCAEPLTPDQYREQANTEVLREVRDALQALTKVLEQVLPFP